MREDVYVAVPVANPLNEPYCGRRFKKEFVKEETDNAKPKCTTCSLLKTKIAMYSGRGDVCMYVCIRTSIRTATRHRTRRPLGNTHHKIRQALAHLKRFTPHCSGTTSACTPLKRLASTRAQQPRSAFLLPYASSETHKHIQGPILPSTQRSRDTVKPNVCESVHTTRVY